MTSWRENSIQSIVISPRGRTHTAAVEEQPLFPPAPENDLIYHGGRLIPDLIFKNCYVGTYWTTDAGKSDRLNIDKALSAAMSDAQLNNVIRQYFGNHPITSRSLDSIVLQADPAPEVTKSDVKRFVTTLFEDGTLAGLDFDNTVMNFMLPPGVVLSSDEAQARASSRWPQPGGQPAEEDEDSLHGLGGYHGSAHLAAPRQTKLYYAVGVYSAVDFQHGDNGIPIPGWEPWQNIVATFYHELNEARTDPDVEDANETGNIGLLGWTSAPGAEIGDFPIIAAEGDPSRVFQKVPLADKSGEVPVQFLYSNAVHGPQGPVEDAPGVDGLVATRAVLGARAVVGESSVLRFAAPANLQDFTADAQRQGWSDLISNLFDQGVQRIRDATQGQQSQFYNAAKTRPAGTDTAELAILWQGFPKAVERQFGTGTRKTWQSAEEISGTQVARYRFQDEYLEWFATRDPASGKIIRVDFTCEGPEYWNFLAQSDPAKVLSLYQAHVSTDVQMRDLFHNGIYDPMNPWNLSRGAMHLIQPSNTLSAEIFIAADATVLRQDATGTLITDAMQLIDCARFGERTRASDPHIGDEVNGLARAGYAITLTDPIGLYIDSLDTTGWTKPDGSKAGDYLRILRGDKAHTVRAVYEVPQGETAGGKPFVVGDILIGGSPIEFGGQIAKNITMRLTGFATGKGSIRINPVGCVDATRASARVASAESGVIWGRQFA